MKANSKSSIGWMIVLMLFGVVVFCGGTKWLAIMLPAAMLVWIAARPGITSGRN